MGLFGTLSGLWAVVTLLLFILMLRVSYKVERRSVPDTFKRWPLRYANPIGVALNIKVARDAETQALRKQLLAYLAAIGVLFVVFILFVLTRQAG